MPPLEEVGHAKPFVSTARWVRQRAVAGCPAGAGSAQAQRVKPNTMRSATADLGYGDIPAAMAAEKAAASDTEH